MSDKTNINKNEDALENATSENKEQNAAALDAAHIAYLVYARKYRKKLQSEKKKTEKSSEGENEPKDEKKTEGGAELSGLAAEPQKEEKNVPSVSEADTIPESAYDGVASADIPAAEESAESAEPITETEEKVVLPDENNESECQKAPAGEAMPKAVDPELDMIITIDSEPEANKNGEECADELDMTIKIGEPEPENEPKTENPPFFGFGAPTLPEKAPSAEFDGDDGKIMLNIEEQIKTDENIININGRVYPEAAFSSLMRERAAIDKMIDDHYRAYAAEMERLRQKHMFLRMDATARAAAERSEEFKLLQKEEERYKREVAELEERRDSAAKAYIDRKAELERIIGEYDARNEELSDAGSAMQRIASGAADVTAAIANGLAAASFDNSAAIAENAVANARIEHERAMAEATLQKERALAEAKLEAEKRALAEARLEAERAQANARMKDLERDIAAKSAPQGEAKPMSQDAEIRAENTEPEKEKEGRHVVVPGDIDKAYDDAELQKKLSEYRKQQKKQADVELQNLSAYIAAANRDISAIEKEYDELWSRQPESDAERVVNAVERLGARRRVVEKMTDKLLACREAGAPVAVCEKHRDELREAVAQYNSVVDEYKELTGHSLTRAQTDMAERVLRGEEYRLLPVITARREVVSKEDGRTVDKISPADERAASLRVETVVGSERQLTARSEEKKPAEAAKREEKVVMSAVTMTAKEIPSFFKKQKQREDKLIERESVLASLRPESTEDRVVVLVERLGTERELIASFSKDLKLAVRTRDKGRIRTYKKQLRSHLEKYNRLAGDYKKITGDTLTPADVNIPEYIVNGEKYRALPVISYRKESPDGALLSDQMGAGTTCGAAYALIPEKQRRALEKRGIIEKTRSTSITGLSKKEAKERLKAEKAALREQAQALAASADENARKSKEEAKLAKRGTKAERERHKAEALVYANQSASDAARSRETAKTEKELKTLKDYEAYLIEKEARADAMAQLKKDGEGEIAPRQTEYEPTAEARELEEYKKLSKREKREKLREERQALLAEAKAYEEEANLEAMRAKEEKKLAKRGKRKERLSHQEEAEKLEKSSETALENAKESKKTAKSLKTENDYERYLLSRAERAEILRSERELADVAAYESKLSAKRSGAADDLTAAPSETELDKFKKLSKKEKKQKVKEEKLALLAEAQREDETARYEAQKAKEEKKLSKSGRRAERAAHKAEAEKLSRESAEHSAKSKECAKTAKELNSIDAYEKYLAAKLLFGDKAQLAEPSYRGYERHLEARELEREAKASLITPEQRYESALEKQAAKEDSRRFAEEHGAEIAAFAGLSKKEKKARLAKEREALREEAQELDRKAKADRLSAKEAKALSKKGSKAERAKAKAEAKALAERSEAEKRQAIEAKKTAKSLKTVEDYEKYLQEKSVRAKTDKAEKPFDTSAYDRSLEEKPIDTSVYDRKMQEAEMSALALDTAALFDRTLSKRELIREAKRRSTAYEREAGRLEREAKEEERLAKQERRLAKGAKRADKPIHDSEADAYESHSRELKEKAEAARIEAAELKELKTLKAFEKYNAKKEALAAEKLLSYDGAKEQKREADFADADRHIKHNRAAIEKFLAEQSEYDEMMLKRRYETRLAVANSKIEIAKLHFGEKNGRYVKKRAALSKLCKRIEDHIPKAMKAERRDNERYYSVVKSDIQNMKLPKSADRDKLTKLQIDIESLLRERDAINRELSALYNSTKTADDPKNTTNERLKTATKGAKAAYKKQRKLANEIDSLHITVEEKKKIFEPMNRITQINAEITDLTYRIEREKLKGRAKSAAISSINKKKAEIKHLEKSVKALTKKARRKSYIEREERKTQVSWIIAILLIAAAAAACYFYRGEILSYLRNVLPEAASGILNAMLGGANNG